MLRLGGAAKYNEEVTTQKSKYEQAPPNSGYWLAMQHQTTALRG
jgi:hypothetical protein